MPRQSNRWLWSRVPVIGLLSASLIGVLQFPGRGLVLNLGTPPAGQPDKFAAMPSRNQSTEQTAASSTVPQTASPAFELRRLLDIRGKLHEFHPERASIDVFVFVARECPISNQMIPELNRLQAEFQSASLRFFAVYPEPGVTPGQIHRHVEDYSIEFPAFSDPTHELVRLCHASRTPEVVVVQRGEICYQGRIDNRFADVTRPRLQATQHDLRAALLSLRSGFPIQRPRTEPVGCRIEAPPSRLPDTAITYAEHIAPIIQAECLVCHRPGEAAPFALDSYDEIVRHGQQIREVTARRIMPPWKPAAGDFHFQNERRLTQAQIELIDRWVAGGMASGNLEHTLPAPRFASGWQLGTPDLILEMPEEFEIPADGPDIYQHFVIPTGVPRNRLIAAMEFRPGNAAVVHHSLVYFDTSGTARRLDQADPGPGYSRFGGPGFTPSGSLGGWGPGGMPRRLPDGTGRAMWADSDLVLQVHYHPTGRVERDRSRVGLYFADDDAQRLVSEIIVANVDLRIPAGHSRHLHRARYVLPVETCLLDVSPHMHVLGRAISATARTPDGQTRSLIEIRDWDFYWQDHYVFATPVWLPAGTQIEVVAEFDNSATNPLNPNSPPTDVRWGEDSSDEMAICYFQVTTGTMQDFLQLVEHSQAHFDTMMQQYLDTAESPRNEP